MGRRRDVSPEETSKSRYFSSLPRSLTGGSCAHCWKEPSGTLNILNPGMLIAQDGAFSHKALSFPLSHCLFSPDLLSAASPPSLKSLYIISIFLFIFYSSFFFSPAHSFSYIFWPFFTLYVSLLEDEQRYKVTDACLCGTRPLIVSPPHPLSLPPASRVH